MRGVYSRGRGRGRGRGTRGRAPDRPTYPASHPIILEADDRRTIPVSVLNQDLRCPICLGLLRDPVATECLHRFCANCIEKCLRVGKKECPSCRAPVATRRSLRKDKNFAKLLRKLYPDMEAFEGEEEEQNRCLTMEHQQEIRSVWQRQREQLGRQPWEEGKEADGDGTDGASDSDSASGGRNGAGGEENEEEGEEDEEGEEEEDEMEAEEGEVADEDTEEEGDGEEEEEEASTAVNAPPVSNGVASTPPASTYSLRDKPSEPEILKPDTGQYGFLLTKHPLESSLQALSKDFVTVSCEATVRHLQMFLSKKLKLHAGWGSLQVTANRADGGSILLDAPMTLEQVVTTYQLDTENLQLLYRAVR